MEYTQYRSKWSGNWEYFTDSFGHIYEPNKAEISEHNKFYYELRKTNATTNPKSKERDNQSQE